MATIQLLLTDDANRRALASVVEKEHTTVTATTLEDADLYLVDDASLPQYQDALESHKREQEPVFCPVVLIRRPQSSVTVDLPAPDPNERTVLVNETVAAPVETQTLFRRMANLLVRRKQTVELSEKNDQLEQLAGTLRHEVRNPLQVLDLYIDTARERGDAESFDKCQAAIDRMQRLFDETLLIVQGDNVSIDPKPVYLSSLCRECWNVIHESDATLDLHTTQQIAADESRLKQLFENLFRNSVEHAGNEVTVTVGGLEDGFYVEDDGPGIADDEQDNIFETGYTTSGKGTGLGLAVVSEVVDAHGWDIQVTDGTAGGARFEITGVDS